MAKWEKVLHKVCFYTLGRIHSAPFMSLIALVAEFYSSKVVTESDKSNNIAWVLWEFYDALSAFDVRVKCSAREILCNSIQWNSFTIVGIVNKAEINWRKNVCGKSREKSIFNENIFFSFHLGSFSFYIMWCEQYQKNLSANIFRFFAFTIRLIFDTAMEKEKVLLSCVCTTSDIS